MEDAIGLSDRATARVIDHEGATDGLRLQGYFEVVCKNPDGSIAWRDEAANLIVNEGLTHALDSLFAGDTYYVGLTDGTPTVAAGDTMSSHSGWSEVTAYSEGARQTYSPGSASSQSVDNSGNVASFSINGSATVGGAFLSTDNTKSGTSGTLFCVVALSGGDQSLSSGQTLEVTYTLTSADDGA